MSWILFPRFHLAEVEDQSWCPAWLREHSHSALARMWRTKITDAGSPSTQACDILVERLGGLKAASEYTFIDSCAGAGGPTPLLEASLNKRLRDHGYPAVKFVLTDLWPDIKAWEAIAKRSENISYIEKPIDATKAVRLAEPGKKECRIFNLCFHHFDDPAAAQVLRGAVESTDTFIIFEMTHRTLPAILNTSIVIMSPLITTLFEFWYSPIHLLFTYLIPIVPLFYAIDGYVSCIRGRTPKETWDLVRGQKGLDLSKWSFSSGQKVVLPPFGTLYWYLGSKESPKM